MILCHVTAKENITHLDSVIRMLLQFYLYFGKSYFLILVKTLKRSIRIFACSERTLQAYTPVTNFLPFFPITFTRKKSN
jgi:hypothetical protein